MANPVIDKFETDLKKYNMNLKTKNKDVKNTKDFKSTETAKNLAFAYANEMRLHEKYEEYAMIAEGEGLIQISNIFSDTSENEEEHASVFEGFLIANMEGKDVDVCNTIKIRQTNDTRQNLRDAMEGETDEAQNLYPKFAVIAKKEGYNNIAEAFARIAVIEKQHNERYKKLLARLDDGTLFRRDEDVLWKCYDCGYRVVGKEAPLTCPVCQHEQGYFEVYVETF